MCCDIASKNPELFCGLDENESGVGCCSDCRSPQSPGRMERNVASHSHFVTTPATAVTSEGLPKVELSVKTVAESRKRSRRAACRLRPDPGLR